MPTSFGGRRNFTSWGVTLSCPPGAEHGYIYVVEFSKILQKLLCCLFKIYKIFFKNKSYAFLRDN